MLNGCPVDTVRVGKGPRHNAHPDEQPAAAALLEAVAATTDVAEIAALTLKYAVESFDLRAALVQGPDPNANEHGVSSVWGPPIASFGPAAAVDALNADRVQLDRLMPVPDGCDRADGFNFSIDLPELGSCAGRIEQFGERREYMLIASRGPHRPFHPVECQELRYIAQVLALGMRLARSVEAESEFRRRQADEHRSRVEVEARFRTMVEQVPAVVYTAEVGPEGRWLYVSPRIMELLGYTPEEWMADPGLWARCLHPDDHDRALAADGSEGGSGHSQSTDYRMLNRAGEVVWVMDDAELEVGPNGVPVWHGVLYDISARKTAERALGRLAAQQASLAELGERAIEGADLNRLMSAATKLVMGDGATQSCIWEKSPHGDDLRLRPGLGRLHGKLNNRVSAGSESHVAAAMRTSKPVVVDDWEVEERFELPAVLAELGIRSSLAVVIETHDEPYGVLDVHSKDAENFSSGDVHLAQAAANVLAGAIERRRVDAELRHRVLHDGLTGLPNRQRFMELLDKALERARETDAPVAVLFLDLDHFKLINDSLGHPVGDQLLRVVAPRLAGRLRPNDTVARFGGDEFAMLIGDLADEAEAVAIAERIGRALSRPISIAGMEHYITASIGIAVADPRSGKPADAESLVRDADAAMYRAKESGRARHELFGEEMRAHAIRKLETQRKLRRAIDFDELTIHYQPVISLGGGDIVGAEALIRWRHPDRGLLSPQEFIPVAEESGLIVGIGRWVIEEAILQAHRWHQENPDSRPVNIAVNVSPRQVVHKSLIETIEEMLDTTGMAPELLRLEITESVLVEESIVVRETLDHLHKLGVGLVLDDFGTGYSSLAYISRFPLDELKIDRSFIEKLGRAGGLGFDDQGAAIVEAIIAMAHALSLGVIAEGVSDKAQARFLREHDCQMAQGYLFSPPVPPPDVSAMLRDPASVLAPLQS